MTAILEGIYEHGRIQLRQPPAGLPEGRVRVIVIGGSPPVPTAELMTFGKYPGDASTLEDFNDAEWRGEREWDGQNGR